MEGCDSYFDIFPFSFFNTIPISVSESVDCKGQVTYLIFKDELVSSDPDTPSNDEVNMKEVHVFSSWSVCT